MPSFVEIAVNVPQVSGVFHYHLPEELQDRVASGHLVIVPFGAQTAQGVVLRQISHPEVEETKPVLALVDELPVVTPAQLALSAWMSTTTLSPLAACVGLMLPPGLSQQADTSYSLAENIVFDTATLGKMPARLLALLQKRGPLRGGQIDAAVKQAGSWRPSMRSLQQKGWVLSQPVLPLPTIRPKYIRTAQLAAPPEVIEARLDELPAAWRTAVPRRRKMLELLLREREPVDVTWIYAECGGNLADLRKLSEANLVILREQQTWRDPLAGIAYDPSQPPALTGDQQAVWDVLQTEIQAGGSSKPFLLHGVTGSGKTEIYLQAVAEVIAQGRQAIVLVPEIALTPQTVRRFMARFPGRVGLLHSQLSPGERYDTWRRARLGQLSVIVGPRSALFAPLPQVGLIVVDESHDGSYYQRDQRVAYHSRQVAAEYARLTGAVCIFGSATPSVTSYYRSQRGKWRLLELPARILAHTETVRAHGQRLGPAVRYQPLAGQTAMMELPPVQVVDMRSELKAGNRSIFSRGLQQALEEVLRAKQQAILFLNRRGTATYIFCRDCGHSLRCPRCESHLTSHTAAASQQAGHGSLRCHHCGYQRQLPQSCPQCQSSSIRQYGTGTQKVEAEVRALFPQARTLRWDWETTRKKDSHEIILSHFANQRADILIGTQMLAKGLDLPYVTLVGVVLADVGLHMPDYRAGERVFQVLAQVAGRAGRSPLGGRVILQTFDPDHYVIQSAAAHDYAGFYQAELAYRRRLGYPPFAQLVRLEYRHSSATQAEAEARRLAAAITKWVHEQDRRATEVIGPAPCYFSRLAGQYRWQIVLRGPSPASLLIGRDLGDWRVEVNPQALL